MKNRSSSVPSSDAVDARRLRGAIEFALLVVREARKARSGLSYPSGLDRYAKLSRVPNGSLNAVRRLIEGDDEFRQRLATVVSEDLLDEVGRLWLQRPAGWESLIVGAAAAADNAEAEADLAAKLKRAENRKQAAERSAAHHAAELSGRDQRIAELEAELAYQRGRAEALAHDLDATSAALSAAKVETRHARDKMLAAEQRLDRAMTDSPTDLNRDSGPSGDHDASSPRSVVSAASDADVVGDVSDEGVERSSVAALAGELAALSQRLAKLAGTERAGQDLDRPTGAIDAPNSGAHHRPQRRKRITMPPGMRSDTADGARFLLESGSAVFIDGYNVTKMAWPGLPLVAQRERLIDRVEQYAQRRRIDVAIVFDGGDVIGAHSAGRRRVRVVYSAAEELADDRIRAEVARLPTGRHAVVVTNDQEIVRDVEAMGANTVSSGLLIEVLN